MGRFVVVCAGALVVVVGCGTMLTLDDERVDEREEVEAGRDDTRETNGRAADDASSDVVEQEEDAAPPEQACVPLGGQCTEDATCCKEGGLLGVGCFEGLCQTCVPLGGACHAIGRCCDRSLSCNADERCCKPSQPGC